jgi:hypothetical protein
MQAMRRRKPAAGTGGESSPVGEPHGPSAGGGRDG